MADSPATTYKKERKRGNPLIRRRERLKTSKRKKEGRKGEKIKKKKGGQWRWRVPVIPVRNWWRNCTEWVERKEKKERKEGLVRVGWRETNEGTEVENRNKTEGLPPPTRAIFH